jgi:hypothetical protein
MGRNSLLFFALGSVASAGGRSLMSAAYYLAAPHLAVHLIGLVYTATAVIGMFAVVNRMDRTARRPRFSTGDGNAVAVPMSSLRSEAGEGAVLP